MNTLLKKLNNPWTLLTIGTAVVIGITLLTSSDVLAMTDDTMKDGLEKLERTLTGSWMRIALIAGGVMGVIMSFVKQSFFGIVTSCGTVLGATFYSEWVKTAFTALIP